jgi:hypothetical protein
MDTGLNWSGFYTMNGPLMGNGWNRGAVSGPTVGYFGPGNTPALFKAPGTETFTLNSLTITTAYTYQYVDIKGYLDGVQTTPTVRADIYNLRADTFVLNWSNIDEVRFQNTRSAPYNQEALLDNISLRKLWVTTLLRDHSAPKCSIRINPLVPRCELVEFV